MVIKKLDEAVVNRIAAGEVIQRPVNGIKEMVENCLDAGAMQIQVTVREGGLKFIQITDNGCGISQGDMAIVCERFTTSKLSDFNELRTISTYGFRGEALSSISHIAHVTITTRTADAKCAYRGDYVDGRLKAPVKPCAGNQGTSIIVEDLFYNTPLRRRTLKSGREEYAKIVDVLGKYALHNCHVGFTVRKGEESGQADVKTTPQSEHIDVLRAVFGPSVAREVIPLSHEDTSLHFKAKGLISNGNYSSKKMHFILFINHRLVGCSNLRKALESVYESFLLKGNHPFIYLSLEIAPQNVDVNVHPTKHEVHFLHDDAIIFSLQQAVERCLLSSKESRTFVAKSLLPEKVMSVAPIMEKSRVVDVVRTDSKAQKIDAFFQPSQKPAQADSQAKDPEAAGSVLSPAALPTKKENCRREIKLFSVKAMQEAVRSRCCAEWRANFRKLTFVGCVDEELAVAQLETQLLLLNMRRLTEDFFYQVMCFDFGNFGVIRLSEPAPIVDLVSLAFEFFRDECGWMETDPPKSDLTLRVKEVLTSRRAMLWDYFSMQISEEGAIETLPLLVSKYTPNLDLLPLFVIRLGTEVDWDSEAACFETFCREVARFYAVRKPKVPLSEAEASRLRWTIEHVLFLKLKTVYLPAKVMHENGCILQITDVSKLYKVFERC